MNETSGACVVSLRALPGFVHCLAAAQLTPCACIGDACSRQFLMRLMLPAQRCGRFYCRDDSFSPEHPSSAGRGFQRHKRLPVRRAACKYCP
ncbi:hypothetical protein LHV25_11485 [Providencia rettgeri]|nr:hypothetical protein [Providencia rettgeri]